MTYLRQAVPETAERGGYLNNETKSSVELNAADLVSGQRELLDKIASVPDRESRKNLIARVFDHATADGLKLAEKEQFTNTEYYELLSRPQFYFKHRELALRLLDEAENKTRSEGDKELLAELKIKYANFNKQLTTGQSKEFTAEKKGDDLQTKELKKQIDDWYAQFLQTKKFAEPFADPRSRGERLGEEALAQIKEALDETYYPIDVMRVIVKHLAAQDEDFAQLAKEYFYSHDSLQLRYRHSGFDKYFRDVSRGKESVRGLGLDSLRDVLSDEEMKEVEFGVSVSAKTVAKIKKIYKIDDEQLLKEINSARKKPLSITFRMQVREAEKNLLQELAADGKDVHWDDDTQRWRLKGKEMPRSKYLSREEMKDIAAKLRGGRIYFLYNKSPLEQEEYIRQLVKNEEYIQVETLMPYIAGRDLKFTRHVLSELLDSDLTMTLHAASTIMEEMAVYDPIFCQMKLGELEKRSVLIPGKERIYHFLGVFEPAIQLLKYALQNSVADYRLIRTAVLLAADEPALVKEYLEKVVKKSGDETDIEFLEAALREREFSYGKLVESPAVFVPMNPQRAKKLAQEKLGATDYNQWEVDRVFAELYLCDQKSTRDDAGKEANSAVERSEGHFLTEEKILDTLEDYLKQDVNTIEIPRAMAGLDSDRAWEMRERFIKEGVDKDYIAMGLAGLDSSRAWE
ncbi:MAG: hypothetical protein NUV82_03325, partial [Candidatus Komeilibacteria bacterium]|nr:hypothetical protein [Candidatus Komeilibacteria bacterium]